MSSENVTRLSTREKVGYGLGDTASNIFFFGINGFIFFYYTEVCKIPAASAGTLLLLPRLWDAISDPLMGAMADRTRTRWGTYRPYLLWLAIPFGIFGFLTFANPDLGDTGKLAYAYVTYILLMTVYTAINVPYSALMGVMSPLPEERTKLATYRFVGAFSGQLLISFAFLPLVYELGGGDKGVGFPRAMAVMAVIATVLFFLTFFWTKERVKPPTHQSDLKGDIKALVQNRPWVVMVVAAILTLTAAAVRWTIMPQYLKYYFGVGEEKVWWFMDGTSLALTTGSVAFLAGVFLTPFFSKRFGKRNSLMGLTLLNGLAILAIYFVPRDGYTTLLVLNVVGNLIAGPTPALVWSIYTDVADYGEWKSGRRVTGMAFSAAMFAQKLGISIGPWICGRVLGKVGFDPDQPITESMLEAFREMACLLPGTLAIVNGVVLLFYRLGEDEVRQITADLERRRSED